MPLDDAAYCPTTNKIYGMMGGFIIQHNAVTGAVESATKLLSPMHGPCRICWHAPTSRLYVTGWNDPSWKDYNSDTTSPRADIFPVNPAVLPLAVGPSLNIGGVISDLFQPGKFLQGPWFISSDTVQYLYFCVHYPGAGNQFFRINPANTADNATDYHIGGDGFDEQGVSGFDLSGGYLYIGAPHLLAVDQAQADFSSYTRCNFNGGATYQESPLCAAFSNKAYAVCGNPYLIRVDDFATSSYKSGDPTSPNYLAALNLAAATGIADVAPYRVRAFGSFLFIPCANKDVVILFNTDAGSQTIIGHPVAGGGALALTGFNAPVDVVYNSTGGKYFAVQQGPTGLKEIT